MSNLLLNNTLTEKTREEIIARNPSIWRGIVIEILACLSAIWLGYVYKLFVSDQPFFLINVVPGVWGVIIALSAFFLASLLHVVLMKDFGRRTAVQIVQILGLGFFLYNESVSWLLTEGVAFLILLSGSWRTRSELRNSLHIRFFRVANLYYGRLVLALALMATIFYFPYWQLHKTIIPEPAFRGVTSWSLGMVNNFYPDLHLTPDSTFDEIITSLAQNQMQQNPGLQALPAAAREEIAARASSTINEQIQKQFGLAPQPNESLSNYFYRFMKQGVDQLEHQLGQWFFLGWIIVVLVLSFSIGKVYSLVMSGIVFIVYQVLLASRFVNVYTETVTKETVDF